MLLRLEECERACLLIQFYQKHDRKELQFRICFSEKKKAAMKGEVTFLLPKREYEKRRKPEILKESADMIAVG